MQKFPLFVSLFWISTWESLAYAQDAAQQAAPELSPGQAFGKMIPMLLVVFMIFHFMVIRPQDKKLKAQQKLLAELKRGDTVVTSSGIVGRVASIEDDLISLEISPNVKLRIEPSHITKLYQKSEKSDKKTDDKAA